MARRRAAKRTPPREVAAGDACGLRRCIVTGERLERARLIRFVVGPDDGIVPDLAGRLPGRGLWVRADRACLERAVSAGRFSHAARARVAVAPDLVERVAGLLARRALEYLGLARRAGELVSGYEKARAWVEAGRATVLVQASDGSPAGREKLARGGEGVPIVALFDSSELSLALGRQNVVHAALCRGGLADRFRAEAARLAGFREYDAGSGAFRAPGHEGNASSMEGGT